MSGYGGVILPCKTLSGFFMASRATLALNSAGPKLGEYYTHGAFVVGKPFPINPDLFLRAC